MLDALFEQLKRLGLREKENHPIFGEWEKLLDTKFTKELYLDRKKSDKVGANGQLTFDYRMGPRAMVEIDKKDILQFIALVHVTPCEFSYCIFRTQFLQNWGR